VNKTDLPGVNIEKMKKQLAQEDVLVEGYGGDVVVVPISAKTGQGVNDLLEMISLLADLQGLKDEKSKEFSGVVIEAKLDKFKGPVATILIREGILRKGVFLHTKSVRGKVKSLVDADGKQTIEALPSTPVEVLGFSSVPKVGEEVDSKISPEAEAKEKSTKERAPKKIGLPDKNEVRMIIKADVAGSLEAIEGSLDKLKEEDQKVKIYYSDTGNITESDVLLAAATKSLIIGFNVSVGNTAEKLASEERVLIRNYNVIYELLDELKEGLEALNVQEEKEQ
jgi:translation initiation factor IF-2